MVGAALYRDRNVRAWLAIGAYMGRRGPPWDIPTCAPELRIPAGPKGPMDPLGPFCGTARTHHLTVVRTEVLVHP